MALYLVALDEVESFHVIFSILSRSPDSNFLLRFTEKPFFGCTIEGKLDGIDLGLGKDHG
jgi:hypothetical protein